MERKSWELLDIDWGEDDADAGDELRKHVTKHGLTPYEVEFVLMNEESVYSDLAHPLRGLTSDRTRRVNSERSL